VCVFVRVCACVRTCTRAFLCSYVRMCVRLRVSPCVVTVSLYVDVNTDTVEK